MCESHAKASLFYNKGILNLSRSCRILRVIRIEELKSRQDRVVGKILRTLPEYFGFESAIVDYCDCARQSAYTTYAAVSKKHNVLGVSMIVMNNEMTAQLWLIAVSRESHRRGIGGLLLERSEQGAREMGRQYIMAKTIGPSQKNPNYLKTFEFYRKNGYSMVFEIADQIWGGSHCAIMVKKL